MKIFFPIFCLFFFIFQLSCQSFSYGPPRASTSLGMGPQGRADFDSMDVEDKKDPLGTALIIGLAVAVGVGSAIVVPLALKDKL